MKASTPSSRIRLSAMTPLICGLLCLFLTAGVLASDPDDDWGLPTVTDGDDGSSSSESLTDIQIAAEVIESESEDQMGLLVVDRMGHDGTSYAQGAADDEADVLPAEVGSLVEVQELEDGLSMQGRVLLNLPHKGDGTLKAILRSPKDAIGVRALLTVDDLGSIDELLADPSGIPFGVSTVLTVGQVAVVNLNALKKLVDVCGDQLGGGFVSVVVLSTDSAGELHVSAARISTSGGSMEVVTR